MRFRGLVAPSMTRRTWWVGLVGVLLVACGGEAPIIPTAISSPSALPAAASPTAIVAVSPTVGSAPVSATTPTPLGVGTQPVMGTVVTATGAPAGTASTAAGGATPTPQAKSADPAQVHVGDGGEGYGFNVWGLDANADFRDKVYSNVQGAGFGWMRQQVSGPRWSRKRATLVRIPPRSSTIRQGATAKNLKVMLLSVSSLLTGSARTVAYPAMLRTFTDYMTFLRQRYKGKVQAYEIWNEQNYALETGGKVNVTPTRRC